MNDAEYRRLLKILTVRACRALNVAASRGGGLDSRGRQVPGRLCRRVAHPMEHESASVHGDAREARGLSDESDDERDYQRPAEERSDSEP